MRRIKFLLQKEFRQIFRDPAILRIILVMPVIQLLVLPWAADYEMKNIRLAVTDQDHTEYARQMVNKITASGYFTLTGYTGSWDQSLQLVEQDKADVVLQIPVGFEKQLVKENTAPLYMALNAINGVKASLGGAYLQQIIRSYNQEIRTHWMQLPRFSPETQVAITSSNWYNPLMNYKYFMVPGILVILLTMVGTNLAAINIVKEKEIGTIEQINVTPVKKYQFILSKLIPFWIIGLVVLSIGLGIARLAYGILPVGSYSTIYVFAALFLLAVLGLGLLISTYATNQQQAMLISFFLMMIFILLGGLYTSIDSMPEWAKWITRFNPVSYFIEVMRLVILKGSGLSDIRHHLLVMGGFTLAFNGWAVWSYRKRN